MKRLALAGLAVVVGLVAIVAALVGAAFLGVAPAVDGAVAPHVQLVHDGYVNLYVVDADDGVLLIDCGGDLEAKAVLSALAARHLGPAAVKAIFLTHGHPDHTGGCARFPSAPVYAFEEERGLIEGTVRSNGPLTRWFKTAARRVDRTLADGATALGVEAFLIPGHTRGSAAFFAQGVLFLGDSAIAQTDGRLRATAWGFSDDVGLSRDSVAALASRLPLEQVKWVACSHSGSVPYSAGLLSLGEAPAPQR